jgi:hypothetical protein
LKTIGKRVIGKEKAKQNKEKKVKQSAFSTNRKYTQACI